MRILKEPYMHESKAGQRGTEAIGQMLELIFQTGDDICVSIRTGNSHIADEVSSLGLLIPGRLLCQSDVYIRWSKFESSI